LKKLYSLRVVHLQRADASEEAVAEKVTRFTANFEDADARVARLKSILALFDAFSPSAKDFLTNMLSLPMEIDVRRVREALDTLNEEELAETCAALSQEVEANQKRLEQIAANLSTLSNFQDLDVSRPLGADRWGDVNVQLGFVSPSQAAGLNDNFNAEEWGAMEELGSVGSNALVAVAYLPGQTRAAHDLMGRSGFDPLTIPAEADSLADYVRQLSDEQERLRQRQDEIAAEVERLAASREDVTAALAAAENELVRIRAIEHVAVTGRMGILRGYVREKDAAALDEEISKLQDVAAVYEDAKPGETGVPISLVQSRFFRPGQFLIKMFGVPRYGALDPSPYVLFTFLLFFGFCFGDVLYGLGLIAMGGLLARKLRDYPGLKDFFTLFAYAGVSSVIVGALTGSW
ncbi:MAG: V-type ATPase 116kDa subunit family protein, partial [Phycisphaerae bacterium]|nr:V-type ATPase 116kDa subunit family protein [Phycisphaerae bacterium]